MTTDPSRLHTSLLSGWDRAVMTSLAEDLGREFVGLVLPLLPEAAPELIRLLAGHQGYNELWLLRNHAPLLWRHARAEFVARLDAELPMLTPVELLADIAREAPPHERDLGLDGLSRLADATPPEAMDRALQALSRARTAKTTPTEAPPGKGHGRGGDTFAGWTGADERSLAPLAKLLASEAYLYSDRLQELARVLTPAAATRATTLVLEMTSPYERIKAMMALVSAPRLGRREREELLIGTLALIGTERTLIFDAAELAGAISEVCADGDAVWADRVAGFFDAQRPEREPYLDLVAAFAPLLRRLGGPELIAALIAKLRAPLPVPEFARPWALAARGTFDA